MIFRHKGGALFCFIDHHFDEFYEIAAKQNQISSYGRAYDYKSYTNPGYIKTLGPFEVGVWNDL